MWKDKSEIYRRGNMTGMTEGKNDLIARPTFAYDYGPTLSVVPNRKEESMIAHVLNIRHQETR